jgi:hypothetical protein
MVVNIMPPHITMTWIDFVSYIVDDMPVEDPSTPVTVDKLFPVLWRHDAIEHLIQFCPRTLGLKQMGMGHNHHLPTLLFGKEVHFALLK